jgi:beta-lactamase class A
MNNLLSKKLPVSYIGILLIISCVLTYIITNKINKGETNNYSDESTINACNYNVKRLDGFNFIKPLMFVDDECEGDNLAATKQEVTNIINNYKSMQGVLDASVYIRDYNKSSWTSINEDIQYEPGSLFKVPILIAYLKMDELKPGTLDNELDFNTPFAIDKNVAYKSKSIQLGHKYKIRELLRYMIQYSDNNATALLNNNLKPEVLQRLFSDLNLEVPNIKAKHYYFTVRQYSLFMRALYNASYLSIEKSEFAAELLSKCEFNEGVVNGIPKDTKLIHKFGESGTPAEKQLHESAIIYLNNNPFLITIMTKGKDNKTLSKLIGEITAVTYRNLAAQQ